MEAITHIPVIVWLFMAAVGIWLLFAALRNEIATRRIRRRREKDDLGLGHYSSSDSDDRN